MGTGAVSVRAAVGLERCDEIVRQFEDAWRHGRPDLGRHWSEAGRAGSISLLSALVKAELRIRYDRGERPDAAEYLARFPDLHDQDERALSLIYEEYCLREEYDGRPDSDEFRARYEPWKDSLASQLRYHRVLSQVLETPPPSTRFPAEGENFEQFRLGAELGRGGAGRVYLARDESLGGREVALKVSLDRGSEPSILARLEHAHIVPVHSVARRERGGSTLRGLCMPYRPGLPLDEVIARLGVLPGVKTARSLFLALRVPPTPAPAASAPGGPGWNTFPTRGSFADGVAWIVAVLADALAYAHAQRVFHRDVKPANVLLTYRDGPQLLDFNLSHDPHSADQAAAALQGGTLPYMAPEQLAAFLDPDRWDDVAEPADLYSLGLLLRELLTGRAPETPALMAPPRALRGLLDRRADYQIDLRRLDPRIPHALEAIAGKCLAFEAVDRYQSASALAEDLRRFLARRPLRHASNPSTRERLSNWSERNRARVLAGVLTAGVVAPFAFGKMGPGWSMAAIEARSELSAAVTHLDNGRPADALAVLKRLGPEARRAPVAAFYTAAAFARVHKIDAAESALGRAWGPPDACDVLEGWGRSHPAFAGHAQSLGVEILQRLSSLPPSRKSPALDRAERTFGLVLRLEPGDFRSRLSLAVIEENRGRFASAHGALCTLVATLDAAETLRRASTYLTLARVSTLWGESLLSASVASSDPTVAEGHFLEALRDLERGERLLPAEERDRRFDFGFIRCEATLARVEAAGCLHQLSEARSLLRNARTLLAALETEFPEKHAFLRSLREKMEERLHAGQPRLGLRSLD